MLLLLYTSRHQPARKVPPPRFLLPEREILIKKQDELSIRPATMAGLPRTGPTPLCLGLPEEIFGLEILVRLPPKDLVRCRAVCRAWRRVASTCDLLLAHHRRQPSLPLVLLARRNNSWGPDLDVFNHQTAAAGGEARLQPVARVNGYAAINVAASCDGLLLVLVCTFFPSIQRYFICNPTTRQTGCVPEIHGLKLKPTGLYRHPPTGEYRLLLHTRSKQQPGVKDPCYVLALDRNQPRPRCIGCTPELAGFFHAPVMVRGNLHWSWWLSPVKDQTQIGRRRITVFDTTAESFRLIRSPLVQKSRAYLYEGDDTLGTYSCNDSMTAVDIWMMQDYNSEVWSHRYHVEFPVAEIWGLASRHVMVIHDERDVFVLYNSRDVLFLVDTEGKLLASSQLDAYIPFPSAQRIKESLVQHSFFSGLQGALNDGSLISWLDRGV